MVSQNRAVRRYWRLGAGSLLDAVTPCAFSLAALLFAACGASNGTAPAAATTPTAGHTVTFSGWVASETDGKPLPGARIVLNQQVFQANAQGYWSGAVPLARQVNQWFLAEDHVADGYRAWAFDDFTRDHGVRGSTVAVRSIFRPSLRGDITPGVTPPTVAQFASDGGVAFRQELPARTRWVAVSGTVGRLAGAPMVRAEAYVARPDGFVETVGVHISGKQYTVRFPTTSGPGRYQVEIVDITGAAVINVPIFVGVPYAFDTPGSPTSAAPGAESRREALATLNAVRAAHHLPPLQTNARLDRVAGDQVADMLAHLPPGAWSHGWSDGSRLQDHMAAGGVRVARLPVADQPGWYTLGASEGIVSATGRAAIQQLYSSPSHRKDLLGDYASVGMADAQAGATPLLVIEYAKVVSGG